MSDDDLHDFVNSKVATNTQLQTARYGRKFCQFVKDQKNETRDVLQLEPEILNTYIGDFLKSFRKKGGQEFEPDSLTTIHGALARFLEQKEYPYDIKKNEIFRLSRSVLFAKKKDLKQQGLGNKPNRAEPLTRADEELLWQTNALDTEYPGQLINSVWYCNTKYLGFCGNDESRQLRWGDITLKKDASHGEYLEWNERSTKTRQGAGTHFRSFLPKMFANVENSLRCPVEIYKEYASRRPYECLAPESPYYLAINHNRRESDYVWFKRAPLGVNMVKTMVQRMCKAAGIPGKKTNHSIRCTMITQLSDEGVTDRAIAQLSGHKNLASIGNYTTPGLNQQHGMASILMGESHSRTLPALQPDRSCPSLGPSSTVSRAPLSSVEGPSTSNLGNSVVLHGHEKDLTTKQQNMVYGMFAGANITGGEFTFNFTD